MSTDQHVPSTPVKGQPCPENSDAGATEAHILDNGTGSVTVPFYSPATGGHLHSHCVTFLIAVMKYLTKAT